MLWVALYIFGMALATATMAYALRHRELSDLHTEKLIAAIALWPATVLSFPLFVLFLTVRKILRGRV